MFGQVAVLWSVLQPIYATLTLKLKGLELSVLCDFRT